MSEHHFVVKFDSVKKNWSWDIDTEVSAFPEGTIYLNNKWERSGNIMDTDEKTYNLDELASGVLSSAIKLMNTMYQDFDKPVVENKIVKEMDGVS
jgi:hypothetical protein